MSAIKRALNKVPAALLRSPLHGLMSKRFLLLTFNGRKSGKRYDIPVAYARDGDAFSMTTDSRWWKNLRGESGVGVPVRLRVRGKEYEGVGESITNEGEVTRVLKLLLEEQPGYGRHASASEPVARNPPRSGGSRGGAAEGTRARSEQWNLKHSGLVRLEGADVRGECGSRGPAAAAIGGRHPVERSRIPWHS